MRIVFAGTPEFALEPLKALLDSKSKHQIVGVFTQPDRPAGRGQNLHLSPVKELALLHHIPVYQPLRLKDPLEQALLRDLDPDLMVVVAYGLILPQAVLEFPKYGCINIHASLLPRWRGAAPIQHALLAGDLCTGISIMQMDAGLDTGDVLFTYPYDIKPTETSKTLHDTLSVLGAKALMETLEKLESGTLSPQKQNSEASTYAHKISKQDAKIDWTCTAEDLDRKIRAFNPWPIAFTELQGQTIRVWAARSEALAVDAVPGTIIRCDKDSIDVATGAGVLKLLELQLPGGKRLPVREILKSKHALFQASKFK